MLPLLQIKFITKLCVVAVLPCLAAVYPVSQPTATQDNFAIAIASRDATYRVAGEFMRDGRTVDAPLVSKHYSTGLVVMRAQVTAASYKACVTDGACRAVDGSEQASNLPVVGVSWEDATAYARWFSRKSGQAWRLPTDEEWAFFAADRFTDDVVSRGNDFSERWLAKYTAEAERALIVERKAQPIGSFGMNVMGLADLAGNVWEWTDTCFIRQRLDTNDTAVGKPVENCGVRVVEGRHRAYVTSFVRDARAGGCAVGVPPANLGFRLVRSEKSSAGS